MKKQIIIAIGIICLILILGGTYVIVSMEIATSKLDQLIVLHEVEILRERLVIHLNKVQSDLSSRNSPYETNSDVVIANVRS